MIAALTQLNWIAVVAAFVPYFVLGALWFTLFFAGQYRRSLGRERAPAEKPSALYIVGPMLCTAAITLTTAILLAWLAIESLVSALGFAVLVGLGYLVANTMNIAINPNIPRPLLYGLISGSYHLVGIALACAILAAF